MRYLKENEQYEYIFTCQNCGNTLSFTQSEIPSYKRPTIKNDYIEDKCVVCGGLVKQHTHIVPQV